MMEEREQLHFKTNVQLKSIIGKDLINDDNIAILELVKNSFDADAKLVTVRYLNLKENDDLDAFKFTDVTSRLVISDDGLGMDMDDIREKWLNIAYSQKKENSRQHKRRMAGAKGVGRFSCDRLGEFLNLYTKKKDDSQYIKLSIDWKEFEIQDERKEIQSVGLDYELLSEEELNLNSIPIFEQGLCLEIIKLRSIWAYPIKDRKAGTVKWDTSKFVNLKKYLEKLINPNQAFENDDFGIYLDAPEFERESGEKEEHERFIGKVENRIFDKLDFKSTSIEAKTIDKGQNIFTELKDKGETIFWIKEVNPFYPFVKDVHVSLFYLNSYAKAFFTKQTGVQPVNYGSVFLFINGFRIPPYGDVGNDWLGLDQRKAQGTAIYIGQRDIVGRIEILDEHNDFQIISSREGVARNDNFKKLTNSDHNDSFFFKALRRLERYVVDGLAWDSSVYDPKESQFKEIERKIIEGKTAEDDLKYREGREVKRNRVYLAIHSIISAKPDDVIELYINQSLIVDRISEERERSDRDFQKLLDDFANRNIDEGTLSRILFKKAEQNAELAKQIREFSKYTVSEATEDALQELRYYRQTIEKQALLIENLQVQLVELRNEREKSAQSQKSLSEQVKVVQQNLATEKQKNAYLLATRRTLSPDADGLIHTIKINNIEIREGIDNILDDLIDGWFDKQELIRRLGFVRVNAERSLKLAEIATRSNFNEDIEKRTVDVVKFIDEYVEIYGDTYGVDDIRFLVQTNGAEYRRSLSVLNLSIVLDNLISNALKWSATEILFRFEKRFDDGLSLIIADNGLGLSSRFLGVPDSIFDLSVRETSPKGGGGSGIGLYYSRKLLEEMGMSIKFLGNGNFLSGASFEIVF